MRNLTAGEAIQLIEDFSVSPSDIAQVWQSQDLDQSDGPSGGFAFLKRYLGTKKNEKERVSAHSVSVWIQSFHDGALEAVKQSLAGIPANQPLNEADLSRVQEALKSRSAVVEANLPLFHKINPAHSSAVLKVATLVFGQLKQVIRQAASHQPDTADMAT